MDFPRAQAIFHSISRLESQYRHSHLPNNGFAVEVANAAVSAVAANEDPALAVKLIASVEEVFAAMVTRSHSNSLTIAISSTLHPYIHPSIHSSIDLYIQPSIHPK